MGEVIYLYCKEIEGVWYAAAIRDSKVYATSFAFNKREALKHLLVNLPYDEPFQLLRKTSRTSQRVLKTLKLIYDGKDVTQNFKLALNNLTTYTKKVLNCTCLIPIGYVTTYKAMAEAVGGSPRAVGGVMARNPFPLLIPCHRVVRKLRDEKCVVGGYFLGTNVKSAILHREDRGYSKPMKVKLNNKSLLVYPIKFLINFPR